MKLHILSEVLQKKLPFVNHAISSKSQLPILLNFFLEAENGVFKIHATDLEIGIEIETGANIEETGGITIPAKIFSELIATLPPGKITLQTKDNTLEVISPKSKSVFQTIPKDEFPRLYEEKGEEVMVIKKNKLQEDFGKVVFAASFDMSRPALSGVLIKKNDDEKNTGFTLVATDGYRLSLQHHTSDIVQRNKKTLEKPTLLPSRLIREIIGLKQDEGDISMFVSDSKNQVLFSQGDTTLVGRLIDAQFPNYEKIIPVDFDTKVLFEKEELQKAVKVCSIFSRETANIVKFTLQKDKIIVSANTPNIGENTVEVEASLQGEENAIAFNAKYLLDLLSNVGDTDMSFEMSGPLNPGVFRIKNNPTFLHLIMPIRVQEEA